MTQTAKVPDKLWYVTRQTQPDWKPAIRHLSKDPVMKRIIQRIGVCTLVGRKDYFNLLCLSIFNQQISMKVATVLYNRFRAHFPGKRPTPARVITFLQGDEELIRRCGISRQKRLYLIDLAEHFVADHIPTRRLKHMGDDEVIESLTRVKGIGRWTAEMFLMFVLNRPDVWPIDDLGLQEAYKRAYGLEKRPTAKELEPMGEKYRPFRTVATWYLWRGTEDQRRPKKEMNAETQRTQGKMQKKK